MVKPKSLIKIGRSLAVTIPPEILKENNLKKGDLVNVKLTKVKMVEVSGK